MFLLVALFGWTAGLAEDLPKHQKFRDPVAEAKAAAKSLKAAIGSLKAKAGARAQKKPRKKVPVRKPQSEQAGGDAGEPVLPTDDADVPLPQFNPLKEATQAAQESPTDAGDMKNADGGTDAAKGETAAPPASEPTEPLQASESVEVPLPATNPPNAPLPQARPESPEEELATPAPAPETAPLPTAKPGIDAAPETAEPPKSATPPPPPDPRSAQLPDPSGKLPPDEVACRARLTALGATFEAHAAEFDPEIGCAIPYPIMLKSFGKDISLKPAAEMNCTMAEAAARFMQDVAAPAAMSEFGTQIRSISHASAYVCRPRHGTQTLSEHAFGNALDIASFTLANGTTVQVELQPEEKLQADEKPAIFLGRLRKAACGPFKTVLGPGSDADHATHFHFDMAPRRRGGTFCQ
jgi:hypothetical protein